MTRPKAIKRIVVALDTSKQSILALESAAEIASLLHAELVGLFVKDINLLRCSQLPFVEEVLLHSGQRQQIDTTSIELSLKSQALFAQRVMENISKKINIKYSFSVVEGKVNEELISAAQSADLLILGQLGYSDFQRKVLGTTTEVILTRVTQPVILTRTKISLNEPIVFFYDISSAAQNALHIIKQIFSFIPLKLTVFTENIAEMFKEELPNNITSQIRNTPKTLEELASIIYQEKAVTVILPITHHLAQKDQLISFMQLVDCAIMLVK